MSNISSYKPNLTSLYYEYLEENGSRVKRFDTGWHFFTNITILRVLYFAILMHDREIKYQRKNVQNHKIAEIYEITPMLEMKEFFV